MVQSYPSYPLKWEQCLASNSKAQGGAIWGQAWIQWSLGHVVEVIMVSEGSVRHPWLLWLDGLLPQCWPACCPRHGWDGAEKMLSLLKKRKISKVSHTLHLFPLKIRPLAKSYMPQNFIFLSTFSCLEVSHTGPWTHSCARTRAHTHTIHPSKCQLYKDVFPNSSGTYLLLPCPIPPSSLLTTQWAWLPNISSSQGQKYKVINVRNFWGLNQLLLTGDFYANPLSSDSCMVGLRHTGTYT